jgi:hypothetical protein
LCQEVCDEAKLFMLLADKKLKAREERVKVPTPSSRAALVT